MKIDLGFFFQWGFRPFFILSGLSAIGLLTYWLLVLKAIAFTPETISLSDWHAHEMIFGFGAAALAGFLLTAIPEWTGATHLQGRGLALYVGLWLFGRLSVALIDLLPLFLVGLINVAFPLILAWHTLPHLMKESGKRHHIFIPMICLFIGAQIAVYLGWSGVGEDFELSRRALLGGVYALIFGIIITSTRISMVVIRLALDEQNDQDSLFRPYPYRRNLASVTFLFFAAADIIIPETSIMGWFALAAGAALMDRLSDFHVGRVLLKPYVQFLYVANFWIALGCLGMGVNAFLELGAATDLRHFFSVGAIGTAILMVFTIAGLRHSGFDLIVPKRMIAALLCMMMATGLRVLPAIPDNPLPIEASYDGAACFMILSFILFLSKFIPIFCRDQQKVLSEKY